MSLDTKINKNVLKFFLLIILISIYMLLWGGVNDISAAAPEEMGIAPPGDTSRYDSIQIRTQEMLYRETVLSDNPQKYLEFLYRYPDTYFGGLISCRYILLELNRGAQVPVLVHNLNEIGVDAHIMNLYPMIRGKPESLTRAIVFPQARIRMLLRQNYAGQLNKDPLVELYLDYYRTIRIPFDALHLMARKKYFRIESEEIQFIIADSSGLKLAQQVHNQLNFIIDDLSRNLRYSSAADAISELFDRTYLLQQKLTVFVYNPDTFIEMYQLHSAGWDYPFQGMIHITPDFKNSREFLKTLIRQISHILLGGNIFNIHHSASRWFDMGFARWVSHCYLTYQTLEIQDSSYHSDRLQKDIQDIRSRAAEIYRKKDQKRIKFSQLNKDLVKAEISEVQKAAETLSLSVMAYLVKEFGQKQVIYAASRVSHVGQNFNERALVYILGVDYDDIQKGWNQWLRDVQQM